MHPSSMVNVTGPANVWSSDDPDADADIHNQPALSIFMWQDGANFQWLVNHNMGFANPPEMNPDPLMGVMREMMMRNNSGAEKEYRGIGASRVRS